MRSGYTVAGYTVAAKTLAKRYIVESGGKSYRAHSYPSQVITRELGCASCCNMASYVLRQRSGSGELSERLSDQPAEEY